ncbi:hypothetical protein U0070_018636, partial [Myodes glareolus]
ASHPELAAAGIQGEEGGIGGGEDGGGGGRGEARGAGEGSARGGWAGANAGLRELSGRLRRAARAAAPARSELPEPGCVSIRSYKLRARSQQAAWCSQTIAAAAVVAAAGGRSDGGNFLDEKQWLTTISQYDKEVGQWNKFRDVSDAHPFAVTRI